MTNLPYPYWSREELERRRSEATALFRAAWSKSALQKEFRELQGACAGEVRALLQASENLRKLANEPDFFDRPHNKPLLPPARFITVPLLSEDNLKVLAGAREAAEVIIEFLNLDRFPWMNTMRGKPTAGEVETAVQATAELMAIQRFSTARRVSGAKAQEETARECLTDSSVGLRHVPPATVRERAKVANYDSAKGVESHNVRDLLTPGEFTSEFLVAGHKSDLPVLLPSGVLLTLECKVSNSATNSVKRIIRETDGKRRAWREAFGKGVMTGAVIAGVFSMKTLTDAQEEGMLLFFDHDIEALGEFVRRGGVARPKP